MELKDRLKALRTELGLTQQEVADKLGIIVETYRKYETGKRNPGQKSLQNLANILQVSVSYLIGETNIRSSFKITEIMEKLSEPRQKKMEIYGEQQLKEQEEESKIILLNRTLFDYKVLSDQALSAGKGNSISDDISTYTVQWTKWINHDFGVLITGDSMEPDYHNQDIALVQEQSCPDFDGQVCAIIDFEHGVSYIKCVTIEENYLRLVSLNQEVDKKGNLLYEDILLPRDDTVKILGKVIECFTPV